MYGGLPLDRGHHVSKRAATHIRSVVGDHLLDGLPLALQFDRRHQCMKRSVPSLLPSVWLPVAESVDMLLSRLFSDDSRLTRRRILDTIDLTQSDGPKPGTVVRPIRQFPLSVSSSTSDQPISAVGQPLTPLMSIASDAIYRTNIDPHTAIVLNHYCSTGFCNNCHDDQVADEDYLPMQCECPVSTHWCNPNGCIFNTSREIMTEQGPRILQPIDCNVLPLHCSMTRPDFITKSDELERHRIDPRFDSDSDDDADQSSDGEYDSDFGTFSQRRRLHDELLGSIPSYQSHSQHPMTVEEQRRARTLSHMIAHSGIGYMINDPVGRQELVNCKWDRYQVARDVRCDYAVVTATRDIEIGEELFVRYRNAESHNSTREFQYRKQVGKTRDVALMHSVSARHTRSAFQVSIDQ